MALRSIVEFLCVPSINALLFFSLSERSFFSDRDALVQTAESRTAYQKRSCTLFSTACLLFHSSNRFERGQNVHWIECLAISIDPVRTEKRH